MLKYFADEARSTFKKHVNALANIKNQNNEKWLILKKKYIPANSKEEVNDSQATETSSANAPENIEDSDDAQIPPPRPPLPLELNQDFSILNNLVQENSPKTPVSLDMPPSESKESLVSIKSDDVPPKVNPRRKSSADKIAIKTAMLSPEGHRSSISNEGMPELNETTSSLTSSRSESMLVDSEQKISVKERKQMFNRMASESDVLKSNKSGSFGPHVSIISNI